MPRRKIEGKLDQGEGANLIVWNDPPTGTLSPLPGSIAAWAREGRERTASSTDEIPEVFPEGSRDNALTRMGGKLRRDGLTGIEIYTALLQINASRCQPPLPDEDVERIARSVERYAPEPEPEASQDLKDAYRQFMSGQEPVTEGEEYVSRILDESEIANLPNPEWLVEKVIPKKGVGQIFGQWGSGKSFAALDLALRVANGLPAWFDNDINFDGPVLYCMMEGMFDLKVRIAAWEKVNLGGKPSKGNFYVLPEESLDLSDKESVAHLLRDIAAKSAELQPKLIIIDTQARAMPGKDENATKEMGLMLENCLSIAGIFECSVILIHHSGYTDTNRGRGSSSIPAGLDFIIKVDPAGIIEQTKNKYGPKAPKMYFELKAICDSAYCRPVEQTEVTKKKLIDDGSSLDEKIRDILRKSPLGTVSETDVIKAPLGKGEVIKRDALRAMMARGEVVPYVGPGSKRGALMLVEESSDVG